MDFNLIRNISWDAFLVWNIFRLGCTFKYLRHCFGDVISLNYIWTVVTGPEITTNQVNGPFHDCLCHPTGWLRILVLSKYLRLFCQHEYYLGIKLLLTYIYYTFWIVLIYFKKIYNWKKSRELFIATSNGTFWPGLFVLYYLYSTGVPYWIGSNH